MDMGEEDASSEQPDWDVESRLSDAPSSERYRFATVEEASNAAESVRFQSEALRVNGDGFAYSLCQEALAAYDFMVRRCRILETRGPLGDILAGEDAELPSDVSDSEVAGMLIVVCADAAAARQASEKGSVHAKGAGAKGNVKGAGGESSGDGGKGAGSAGRR